MSMTTEVSSYIIVGESCTHKCGQMVKQGKSKAHHAKMEKQCPFGVICWFIEKLVVAYHHACGDKVRQDGPAQDDQNMLGNKLPWRMAGSEKRRL